MNIKEYSQPLNLRNDYNTPFIRFKLPSRDGGQKNKIKITSVLFQYIQLLAAGAGDKIKMILQNIIAAFIDGSC